MSIDDDNFLLADCGVDVAAIELLAREAFNQFLASVGDCCPEENRAIAKAALLRVAKVAWVDAYLQNMKGATYEPVQ